MNYIKDKNHELNYRQELYFRQGP